MVFYWREKNGIIVWWFDGRLPCKSDLSSLSSRKRFMGAGLTPSSIEKFGLHYPKDREKKSRNDLVGNIMAAYIESDLERYRSNDNWFQILLMQPKFEERERPRTIRNAEHIGYDTDKFFPDDDPLLTEIHPHDILHVKPRVPYLSYNDYYEIIALYPKTHPERGFSRSQRKYVTRQTCLDKFATHFGFKNIDPVKYRNYPMFEHELRYLLRKAALCHLQDLPANETVLEYRFKIRSNVCHLRESQSTNKGSIKHDSSPSQT